MGYKTIRSNVQAEFVEKKSQFIGYIAPVKTNDEAVAFIESIRAMHRKATHNVYAYILRQDNITRYSDDGEPQGTAGIPVLDVLKKQELTDICCVVTRYFGGILLGGGGLVRAYSHSAAIAVEASSIMEMCNCYEITASMDYTIYGKVNYILPEFNIRITDTQFEDIVTLKFLVKSEICDTLTDKLVDISNGQIKLAKSDEMCADFA